MPKGRKSFNHARDHVDKFLSEIEPPETTENNIHTADEKDEKDVSLSRMSLKIRTETKQFLYDEARRLGLKCATDFIYHMVKEYQVNQEEKKAQNAKSALDALSTLDAKDAKNVLEVLDVLDAKNVLDAQDAKNVLNALYVKDA